MRRFFHSELESFRSRLVLMGEKAVEQVRLALQGLNEGRPELAKRVLELDDEVDQMEKEIDNEAIRYISLRAPVASNLRLITTGMKAGHDFERVGDEASTIAKRTLRLQNMVKVPPLRQLPRLGELAFEMLRDSIDCLLCEDIEKAIRLPGRDAEVDALHRELYQAFADHMSKNPADVAACLDLIFIAKSIERIADHATNLAEEVIYLYRAQDVRHNEVIKRAKQQTLDAEPHA